MEEKSILYRLGLNENQQSIISFVGGGGKTTTITKLALELKEKNKKVLVTTTTAMYKPVNSQINKIFIGNIPKEYKAKKGSITVFADYLQDSKIRAKNLNKLEEIIKRKIFDFILIEADGSRGKPIKAPHAFEPVVTKYTDYSLGLIGFDSIGRDLSSVCHRPEIFQQILNLPKEHIIGYMDIVNLVRHELGLFKNCKGRKILYLNKVKEEDLPIVDKIRNCLMGENIKILVGKYNKEVSMR